MKAIAIALITVAIAAAQNDGLYTTVVSMALHKIGYDEEYGCNQNALLEYVKEVFEVDNATHEQALQDARNIKVSGVHLAIEVLEGKDLEWKDSNGKSDPYCVLYVESSPTWRYETAIKKETLTPIWNEYLELPMEDAENDVLWVVVWDSDPDETFAEKMKQFGDVYGVKGFFRLTREIVGSGVSGNPEKEIIGKCSIAVKDIKLTGQTRWYVLKTEGSSKDRGRLCLKLGFTTKNNTKEAVEEHRHLLRALLLHELKTEKPDEYCWWDAWSPAAGTLINQHRARKGLLHRNVALSKWIEYSSIHGEHPLHFVVFDKLSNELLEPMTEGLFSSDDITLFWESARRVLYSCFDSVKEIEGLPKCSKNLAEELTHVLRIISTISSLNVPENLNLFPNEMYNWLPEEHDARGNVLEMLEYTIREKAVVWWSNLVQDDIVENATDQDAIEYCLKIIELVMAELQRASDIYDSTFIETLNFSYARIFYIFYRDRVSDLCVKIVKDICFKLERMDDETNFQLMLISPEFAVSKTLFKLYLALQKFVGHGRLLGVDDLGSMAINDYYEWLRCGVSHWLEVSKYDADEHIKRSMEIDQLDTPEDSYKLLESKSADAVWIIYKQMTNFWTEMAWPNVEESLAYIEIIINHARHSAMSYADMMLKKLENIRQKSGETEDTSVSKAWCFVVSNIDYVKKIIRPWADDVPKLVDKLYNNETQREGHYFRAVITELVDKCIDSLDDRIVKLFEDVANKIVGVSSGYLKEDTELLDEKEMRSAAGRFDDYLEDNTRILEQNLSQGNFHRLRIIILEKLLQSLFQLVINNLNKDRPAWFYTIFGQILRTLETNFSDSFNNESGANFNMLKKIQHIVKLNSMETTELIHLYYTGRIEEQENSNKSIDGILAVRAEFVNNSLSVEVLNGRNLRPMDSGGENNRYVKLRLLPEKQFMSHMERKTNVQKDTLYPLFDETFKICLTREQRKLEDAILIFEVLNYTFTKTTFMAEAFLPFREIPVGSLGRDFKSLKQKLLNLSRSSINTSPDVVTALERRKSDKKATKFIAKLRQKYHK